MKLIIDMPEEAYKHLLKEQYIPNGLDIEYFIIHGIPLPEGHGDLIDSNVLCEQYERTNGDLYQALDLTPIIIETDKGE